MVYRESYEEHFKQLVAEYETEMEEYKRQRKAIVSCSYDSLVVYSLSWCWQRKEMKRRRRLAQRSVATEGREMDDTATLRDEDLDETGPLRERELY